MTWVVPAELEAAVYAAAREVVGDAALATPELVRAIVDRSKRYTSERDRQPAHADRTADLAARAAFFTIADAIKIAIPLAELAGRGALPARRPLRVVDLGAGCGAMTLGLVAMLARSDSAAPISSALAGTEGPAVEVLAIDRDVEALRIAGAAVRALAERYGIVVDITTRAADVASTSLPPADLVIAGTVFNELPNASRLELVSRALAALGPDGALIVIEPALRDTSRALHELRDAVLADQRATVFAPCTRRCAPCPALADPADWCHEDRAVALPPRTAELARLTHLRDAGLKFAYLVLRASPLPLVDAPGAWRVVSAPRVGKGKHEVFGCSDAGRVPIRLLKRHRTAGNRAFERAQRGDVLVIDAEPEHGRVELRGEANVVRVEPTVR